VSKLVNIANVMNVEQDVELYKRILVNEIEQFTIDMQCYDFNLRSGSFLDADHKLYNKFITAG